jgi:iron complex transport system ATP-binding protein
VEIGDVRMEIAGTPIVTQATMTIAPGEVAGLIGPNGSGKSTLLRAVYRHLRPVHGVVSVDGEDVWTGSAQQAARRTAAVPQERPADFDVTVWELVAMGRMPHKRPFDSETAADRDIVASALERVGLSGLAGRAFAGLSGGEKQLTLVARALAQQTLLLVLDEPTNHLDVHHQLELLELVRALGLTTLMALHDLNLAASYCDSLQVIADGRVMSAGSPAEVLTPEVLREVFLVDADVSMDDATGRPRLWFRPLGEGDRDPAATVTPHGA